MANDLNFSSAHTLAQAIRTRQISAQDVVAVHLAQLEAVNPQINALIQWAPDALAQAQQADADRADGTVRGPLHGVPFSLTGYPCVVVPVSATAHGLPVGVQVVAHPWREDIALTLARLLEQECRSYVARKQTKEADPAPRYP